MLTCACICAMEFHHKRFVLKEYASVSHVFLADLERINHDSSEYEMIVCEVLKGPFKPGQIICASNDKYCEPSIHHIGQYLMFGSVQNGLFEANACGFSTHLDNPVFYPPPPPIMDTESEYDLWRAKQKIAFKEILDSLRSMASTP